MASAELTQQTFDRIAYQLCMRTGARLIRKEMAVEMQVIAVAFNTLRSLGVNVPVGGDFMAHYATSLGIFIYLPGEWPLEQQLESLVHECQHVHQFWGRETQAGLGGGAHFGWLYLTEPEARVRYEVDAYRAGFEFAWALRREVPDIDRVAEALRRGYMLDDSACLFARDLLETAATSVVQGDVSTKAARDMIALVRTYAPELLGAS